MCLAFKYLGCVLSYLFSSLSLSPAIVSLACIMYYLFISGEINVRYIDLCSEIFMTPKVQIGTTKLYYFFLVADTNYLTEL